MVVTVVSSIVNLLAMISPPTYKLPPIPTPPYTCSAPVAVEVALVLFAIINVEVVPGRAIPAAIALPT